MSAVRAVGPCAAGNGEADRTEGYEPPDKTGVADKQAAVSLSVYRICPVALHIGAVVFGGGADQLIERFGQFGIVLIGLSVHATNAIGARRLFE